MTDTGALRVQRSGNWTPQRAGGVLLGIAAAFMVAGVWLLALAQPTRTLRLGHLVGLLAVWGLAWGGTVGVLNRRLQAYDPLLIPTVALLTGWGLLIQARLAPWSLLRQMLWLVLGCVALCSVAVIPSMPRMLRRYRYTLLTAGLVLLGATLIFGVNPSGYGQRLWLGLWGMFVQPSELLKLLLVIYLASHLSDRRELLLQKSPSGRALWMVGLGPMAVMIGIAFLLLGWQQDLGAALLYYMTFVAMLYLAIGQVWPVVVSLVLFAPVAVAGAILSSRVMLRVSIWLDPWAPEQADRAFQILQSLFAIAAGRLGGEGLGYGFPEAIPAVHTDFVYSALVEEFGLFGGIAVLVLLALVIYRGLVLAQRSSAPFESLLAGGIAALIGIQTWVIVGGNIKLIPITGVTLPFLSYGGSSLVTMLTMVGLLVGLSAPHPVPMTLMLPGPAVVPLRHTVKRLGQGLLLLTASLALYSGVWSILRSSELGELLTNPRLVVSEARIRLGQILDRNGAVLADTAIDEDGYVERRYAVPEAAPILGYATLDYGTSGIQATCAARLRGESGSNPWRDAWNQVNHIDPVGRSVRLTIDARLQQEAQSLLGGNTGAVVLVDGRTGETLVLASSPTFDPGRVAETWSELLASEDAPLLNRATQSLAQPGRALGSVLVGLALEEGWAWAEGADLSGTVQVNGLMVECTGTPVSQDWAGVLRAGCPSPFVDLGEAAGLEKLSTTFERWRLTQPPALEIPTVGPECPSETGDVDLAAEALGQGQLLVTPLQMALVVSTLANDGARVPAHLLLEPQEGCDAPPQRGTEQVVTREIAQGILATWTSYGEQVIGHLARANAGPDRVQVWFLGVNSSVVPRYGVVVLIDSPDDPSLPARIGTQLLQRAGSR